MGFSISSRRRKILLVCAAVGVGYGSYRLYNSSKRKRIVSLLASLSQLTEAFAEGVESTALLFKDLKAFISSEDDEIPGSLKQVLKIIKCREFQESLTAFSSCVSRGLISSVVETTPLSKPQNSSSTSSSSSASVPSSRRRCSSSAAAVRIFFDKDPSVTKSKSLNELEAFRQADIFWRPSLHQQQNHSAHQHHHHHQQQQQQQQEGIPERLMQKLFTESGKGFASSVLGSVARSVTLSFLEAMQQQKTKINGEDESGGGRINGCDGECDESSMCGMLGLACSSEGKSLIADCIQVFVGTAVSVYLDKTRDVNFYEEMVASITKPCHQPAVRDLLTTVCSGAVETLVKTSHTVLNTPTYTTPHEEDDAVSSSSSSGRSVVGSDGADEVGSYGADGVGSDGRDCSAAVVKKNSTSIVLKSKDRRNWIDGVSRTLAVPSNRKLLIDVAGTVTSEAIHSFFDVLLGVVAPYLKSRRGNAELQRKRKKKMMMMKRDDDDDDGDGYGYDDDDGRDGDVEMMKCHSLERKIVMMWREIGGRWLVVVTVCLAIIMHVFVDVRALEPIAN